MALLVDTLYITSSNDDKGHFGPLCRALFRISMTLDKNITPPLIDPLSLFPHIPNDTLAHNLGLPHHTFSIVQHCHVY